MIMGRKSKIKVGIIGSNGFLGTNLISRFKKHKKYIVIGITKSNYASFINDTFDVLINANGNSKKFWANENPSDDFVLSTHSVYNSVVDFKCKLYIYISSIDVYKNNVYGFNKKLSEQIVKKFNKNYIIFRCASIIGDNMKKGVFYDILFGNKVFVSPDSKLQFISCEDIFNIMHRLIELDVKRETFNLCGRGNISVKDIGNLLHKDIEYNSELEDQCFDYSPKKLCEHYHVKTTKQYIEAYRK